MWKCNGFALFDFLQLQFDEKNCEKYKVEKIRENTTLLGYLTIDRFNLTKKNCENSLVEKIRENVRVLRYLTIDNFNLTRKIVKNSKSKKFVKMQ